MADTLDTLIEEVLVREGRDAYTNDPSDAGGPTKYGVTLATLHAWRNAPVSAADVQALTQAEAVKIYRNMFVPAWYAGFKDPSTFRLAFDFGTNSGPENVALATQAVLKHIGYYDGELDGAFGPKSQAALARVKNWPAFFYALKCERYELLLRYIGRRPENAKYATGWSNRQDQFELAF